MITWLLRGRVLPRPGAENLRRRSTADAGCLSCEL